MAEVREALRDALASFAGAAPLHQSAAALLGALGYESERTGGEDELAGLHADLEAAQPLSDRERGLLADWQSAQIVFQFTEDELAGGPGRSGDGHFDRGRIESFLFIAVELTAEAGRRYPRTRLADMTRVVNRRYPMPAILLFRHGATVTAAVVGRRIHRRAADRDVLQQVTLIKDIRAADPHRAHLDALADLTLPRMRERDGGLRSFEQLHRAWERALDSDALNRRFYRELFAWFERAVAACRFPDDGAGPGNSERHVIRFITRLLFIWFLREKELVPDDLFDEEYARTALRNPAPERTDYYRAVLQNLFFATLNTEIPKRVFSARNRDSHRDFSKYRYRALLREPDAFLRKLNRVPFVNGGLFDCLDDYEARGEGGRRIDAFTDNVDTQGRDLVVPAALFFDADKGLFPLFRRYKFTVEENTPLDQDVALDPELLGRVFENLLAAYNPETRDTARKQTGSYYTPRRVVDYMVDESLAAALAKRAAPADGDAKFWRERLGYLLDYADSAADGGELFAPEERRTVVRAIAELRILDPAVGSGAFPMGVLHKLTLALRRLDPGNRHWEEYQRERAAGRAGAAFEVDDERARNRELQEISRTFQTYRDSDFGRKLYLIQNGIFGVDLQPVACQIAKLRFFISLIVEQRASDDAADNYGIRPLPNLETRFVAADTLLGLQADGGAGLALAKGVIDPIEAHLRHVREGYFNARTRQQKLRLRAKDDELRAALAGALKDVGFPHDAAAAVAHWDPYHQNAGAAWFDPEWMFGIADGFDVVIGNPPYVRGEKISGKDRLRAAYGEFFRGTADLYTYFFRRGVELLRPGGLLCFIVSNKFMRADYGLQLRAFLKQHAAPRLLLDLGRTGAFDATVRPCIVLADREQRDLFRAATVRGAGGAATVEADLAGYLDHKGFAMAVTDLADAGWSLAPPEWQRIRAKIEATTIGSQPLGEYVNGGIKYGIKTGLNDAFVIDAATRDRLIAADPKSAELIRPWLRGRDLRRWRAEWAGLYVIFSRRGTPIERYPAIEAHLSQFRADLEPKRTRGAKRGRAPGTYRWFEIQANIACHRAFDEPKIIYPIIGREMRALSDRHGHLTNDKCFLIPGDDGYLLALLNSRLLDFYFRLVMPCLDDPFDGGDLEFRGVLMEHVPIAIAADTTKQGLAALAERIRTAKQADPAADVSALQLRIDQAVYSLYRLSPREAATVEAALLPERRGLLVEAQAG